MLCYAGTLWLTVQWPVTDWEQAFVLTEKPLPTSEIHTEDEMLHMICLRYFPSHGPATIEDLQRRSWLGKTQIRKGIESCGNELEEREGYYVVPHNWRQLSASLPRVLFLAWFDEWLLGYKNRTATLPLEHHTWVDVSRNGVFKPTVMIDGKTVWVRSVKHKVKISEVTVKPFESLWNLIKEDFQKASKTYAEFLAKEVGVSILRRDIFTVFCWWLRNQRCYHFYRRFLMEK